MLAVGNVKMCEHHRRPLNECLLEPVGDCLVCGCGASLCHSDPCPAQRGPNERDFDPAWAVLAKTMPRESGDDSWPLQR